jgi:hypothetical protein
MKKGDKVRVIENPQADWMERYRDRVFEVQEAFQRRCLVRMLDVPNHDRYWFTEIENFEIVKGENDGN